MNLQQIEKLRVAAYRVNPTLRLRTMAAAARYIDRVGFCWLFAPARHSLELPSLFEAVKGRRNAHIEDWDSDSDKVWAWKSELPAARRAYYGKAFVGKPVFISLQMLPCALAALGTDAEQFEELYEHGVISYEAKKIFHALDSLGAQPTMSLRAAASLDGKGDNNARYHRGLDELQRRMLVMPIGATNEGGSWPSQIFDLVARWFPAHAAQARELDIGDARRALITRYLKTVIAASPTTLMRLFGIARPELDVLLQDLMACKFIRFDGEWVTAKYT